MSDYVNKVKKDNTTYDINDARIAAPANADVGKVLKVADDLSFEYGEAGGGGGSDITYENVDITSKSDNYNTLADLIEELGTTEKYINLTYRQSSENIKTIKGFYQCTVNNPGTHTVFFTSASLNEEREVLAYDCRSFMTADTELANIKLYEGFFEKGRLTMIPNCGSYSGTSNDFVLMSQYGSPKWISLADLKTKLGIS